MQIVGGYDEAVATWAGQRLGVKFELPYTAFAVVNVSREIIGAAVFNDYQNGGNISWSHVGAGTISRGVIRRLAHYVFVENNVSRVSAKTKRSNSRVARLLMKAGFKFEGIQKRYFGPTKDDDALTYVLFKEDATRWLGAH